MNGGKVLVLGDDTRSFLAIVRSLGRQGITVHVAPDNFASPSLASRYIARVHRLPNYMPDAAQWLAAIEQLLAAERFDLVIPCVETTLLPIARHRTPLAALARLAIPNPPALEALFDKHNTRELARSLGVPVAAGRLPQAGDTAAALFAEFGRPLVVKPRRSYAEDQLHRRNKVEVVDSADRLDYLLARIVLDDTVLEAFLPGRGVGMSVLASRGHVLQAFEHHRVHENGAGSFYRVSAPLTPAFVGACEAMVAALDYSGLAMFEFRQGARAQDWVLLEVNARPWGSMPLPVGLGVDFPFRWYRLLVEGVETPAVPYPPGRYARNLVNDARNIVTDALAGSASRPGHLGFTARRVLELGRIVTGGETYDVLVADDRAPGVRELGEALRDGARRVAARLPGAAAWRRTAARAAVTRALAAASAAGTPPRIAFVCQGNICRSPFAAALLRARLGAAPWDSTAPFEVASFGMIPRPGRPTPALGIAAAERHGVDLTGHRSAFLTDAAAAAATVLVVFDDTNRRAIRERFPDLPLPVVALGDFGPDGAARIEDPIDGDAALFDAVYGRIARGIDGLFARILRP